MGLKDQAVRRGNLLYFRPDQLSMYELAPGEFLNSREDYGDLEQLCQSLITNGFLGAIIVFSQPGDSRIYIGDGHRRYKAALMAWERGHEIYLSCVPYQRADGQQNKPIPIPDLLALQMTQNDGKKLEPLELGKLFTRYVRYNWSHQMIADRFQRSLGTITNYLLLFAAAEESPQLKEMITAEAISPTQAIRSLQAHPSTEAALAELQAGLEVAQADGRTRATGKHIQAAQVAQAGGSAKPTRTPALKTILKQILTESQPVIQHNLDQVQLTLSRQQYQLLCQQLKLNHNGKATDSTTLVQAE